MNSVTKNKELYKEKIDIIIHRFNVHPSHTAHFMLLLDELTESELSNVYDVFNAINSRVDKYNNNVNQLKQYLEEHKL